MRFLSLFSGIEAASAAWIGLGWECVGVAEIETFPCKLLAHYYPDVPNLGSVTNITKEQIEALGRIDLVVGGFPCQDLSVAGKRKGLRNEDGSATRSGLFLPQCKLLNGQTLDGLSSKTYQDYSVQQKGQTLLPWLENWLGANLTYRETDGEIPVWQSAITGLSSGSLWMHSSAEHHSTLEPSHNEEGVSSLSEILETGEVDPLFFLTPKACAGILRRAETRGKKLPEQLERALVSVSERKTKPADTFCQ